MIFLTGMPRCGSTWAGKALAHLTNSRYIHEPINGHRHPEWAAYTMRYFRPGRCDRMMLAALRKSVRAPDRWDQWRELLGGSKRVVLKEVHGTLAVECIERHLKADVIIMTRHPCGVAASWKGLGWLSEPWADGDLLLDQKDLLEDHLAPFQDHILSSRDPFFRIGAYWGAIYHTLRRLANAHPTWQWITHEELCIAPRMQFARLLHALGRPIEPSPDDFFDSVDRPQSGDADPYVIVRESRSEPDKWISLLTGDEIDSVMSGARPFGIEQLLQPRITPPG